MQRPPLLLATAGAAIVAAVVTGILVVGGPGEARRERMDKIRFNDIEEIAHGIERYAQSSDQTLPDTLEAAHPFARKNAPPTDPETGRPYEYALLDAERFELCTVFTSAQPQETERLPLNTGRFLTRVNMNIRGPGRGCVTYNYSRNILKLAPTTLPQPARP